MAVQLDGFAAEATGEEAARLGISVEELVSFSVLYYLADVDSGRIARQIAESPLNIKLLALGTPKVDG